jgi:hypothetical protein
MVHASLPLLVTGLTAMFLAAAVATPSWQRQGNDDGTYITTGLWSFCIGNDTVEKCIAIENAPGELEGLRVTVMFAFLVNTVSFVCLLLQLLAGKYLTLISTIADGISFLIIMIGVIIQNATDLKGKDFGLGYSQILFIICLPLLLIAAALCQTVGSHRSSEANNIANWSPFST